MEGTNKNASEITHNSPKAIVKALEHMLDVNQNSIVKITHNKKNSLKMPIVNTSVNVPHTGAVSPKYLLDNKICIFQYDEGRRRVTIAYQYVKGDQKNISEKDKRFIKYGATIFNDQSNNLKKDVYNKNDHTWTAIRRLLNAPVECELNFYNIRQFKKDLRKFLFDKKYGVSKRQKPKYFHFETDNITNVTLSNDKNSELV